MMEDVQVGMLLQAQNFSAEHHIRAQKHEVLLLPACWVLEFGIIHKPGFEFISVLTIDDNVWECFGESNSENFRTQILTTTQI